MDSTLDRFACFIIVCVFFFGCITAVTFANQKEEIRDELDAQNRALIKQALNN